MIRLVVSWKYTAAQIINLNIIPEPEGIDVARNSFETPSYLFPLSFLPLSLFPKVQLGILKSAVRRTYYVSYST